MPGHNCRWRLASSLLIATVVLGGCASDDGPLLLGAGERESAVGDWDKVDASVAVGVSKVEMAVVSQRDSAPNERVYELVTSTDEPARLTVRRTDGAGAAARASGPQVIDLFAQVGRFGNAEREKALIRAVRARLGDLAGVDFAPIR